MAEHTYKKAPLGKHVTYEVGHVGFYRQGCPESVCLFADIGCIEYTERSTHRTRSEIYTFHTHGQRTQVSITQAGDRVNRNSDYLTYQALGLEILTRFLAVKPDMELVLAESKGFRLTIFALGILSILGALAIGLIALIVGISSDRWVAAALPLTMMALLGYHLVKGFRPWQAPITIPIARRIAQIENELKEPVE